MRPASYLGFVAELLDEAARIVLAGARDLVATSKDGDRSQLVTRADQLSGQALIGRIRAAFPYDAVVEEEHGFIGPGATGRTWVVDPLDGTSNYAAGSPLYGIAVGLLAEGSVVAGGVTLPCFGETYLAERGGGARLNGVRLPFEPATRLQASLVAFGVDATDRAVTRRDYDLACALALSCRGVRSSNSVFDLMMVARGAYGACLHRNTRMWDNVAAQVIVEEAGHVYTDLYGDAVSYEPPERRWTDTFTVRAASATTHAAIGSIVREWSDRRSP